MHRVSGFLTNNTFHFGGQVYRVSGHFFNQPHFPPRRTSVPYFRTFLRFYLRPGFSLSDSPNSLSCTCFLYMEKHTVKCFMEGLILLAS